jgi:predicted amidohydrolase YtcJ
MDFIYYNARIYTLDGDGTQAEAVFVREGRVVRVGRNQDIQAMDGARQAEAVDLKGATLIPGLNDAHTHLLWWGKTLRQVNLVGVDRLEGMAGKVRERALTTPPGEWITGLGWDKNLWGHDFPGRETLDLAAPNHPVALHSKDGHLLLVNSRALELSGIGENTPDPPGGEIGRDEKGQLSGLFKENAVALLLPNMEKSSPVAEIAALEEAIELARRSGLTGVHSIEERSGLVALQRLHERGNLKFRVTVLPYSYAAPGLIESGFRQGFGDEMLRLGQIKFFLDGTLGSQTAAMYEPYLEPHDHGGEDDKDSCEKANRGILRMTEADFLSQARFCIENGFAVAVHVIGDRAAGLGLDVIEQVISETGRSVSKEGFSGLPPFARHRLEHVQLLKAADLPRLARSGIIASVQPTHATTDRDTADRYWGQSRLTETGRGYAYKSLLRSGVHLALGSDVPIEPIAPLVGIYAAVSRKRPGEDRPAWLPHERLSMAEAVRGFTRGAAYAAGEEGCRGIIAPGFLADFTALGQDIFNIPETEILATPIRATIVAGEPVFLEA